MNSDSKIPLEQKQETQVAQLVLEEVISQRNTLMNEVASLHVQLKVTQKRCELLEKKISQEVPGKEERPERQQENSDG